MKNSAQLTDANHPTEDLPRPALWRRVHVLILGLTLAWFISSPLVRAQFECPQGCDELSNTRFGNLALGLNNGAYNTAMGDSALWHNDSGFSNTATGAFTLQSNTTGDFNMAAGHNALFTNTTGEANTAFGVSAL